MKAARIHRHGGPEVIQIDDIDPPAPGDGEVLVQVAATSFNPTELAVRQGIFTIDLPHTLGWDVAGTIDGEPVVGFVDAGAAAEFVTAPRDRLVPTTLPLDQAAAIPVAGLTALQTTKVRKGQRVLINGAGGGIGGFAVQLAKNAGAYVIATASPRSQDAVRRHGADEVIDYTTTTPQEPVDVMIHLVGTPPPWTAPVHPGGRIISAASPVDAPPDVHYEHIVMHYDRHDLSTLVKLVETGQLNLDVTATYPLHAMAEVHRKAEAGTHRGKVILRPSP